MVDGGRALRRLRRQLYLFSFVDEFGPLYALYTLWFSDNGITTAQTSTVFLLWAAVAIVLEVPSGALADKVDRRALIALALGLRATGIVVWLLWPSYLGVLFGAALWSVHSALASGAWEALVYDELEGIGHAADYATVMARVGQFSNSGVAAGTLLATGLLELGVPLQSLGWLTVLAHGASIPLMIALPRAASEAPHHADSGAELAGDSGAELAGDSGAELAGVDAIGDSGDEEEEVPTSYAAWLTILKAGLRTARSTPAIARMVAIGALLEGLFVVDEYVPILARDRGASDKFVPLFVLAVWLGVIVGGEVAARRNRLRSKTLASILFAGVLAVAAALWSTRLAALSLIGLGYAAMQLVWVLGDARMQVQVPTAVRATVTSVRAFFAGLVGAAAFGVIGVLSFGQDPTSGLFVVLLALSLGAPMIRAWLPEAT